MISIRQELTTSMLNKSDPTQSDYRPVEVYYSWKDGYVIEGNTFVAVTIWDAFSVIAATLLMLERAWLTWGRLMNKLVEANAKRVMKQYEVGAFKACELITLKVSNHRSIEFTLFKCSWTMYLIKEIFFHFRENFRGTLGVHFVYCIFLIRTNSESKELSGFREL